jgi:hypothetical protein
MDRGEMNKACLNALDVDSLISELELFNKEPFNYAKTEIASLTQRASMALKCLNKNHEVYS